MLNYLQPGNIIEVTAPAGGVVSGAPVVINQMIGIAATTEDASDPVSIQITGVFTVNKVSAQAWAEGEPIYWDAANSLFTTVEGGLFAGLATAAAANPSSTGALLLVPGAAFEGGFHIGTEAVPLVDDDVNVNFMSAWFDSGATSGSTRGMAIHMAATGAHSYSKAILGDISPSVVMPNLAAIQGEVFCGVASGISGLGYAIGAYFQFPARTLPSGGNYAGMNIEVSFPASCDIGSPGAGGAVRTSVLRLAIGGDTTAKATFEDTGTAFSFVGFTAASASIINSDVLTIGAGDPANVIGLRVGVGPEGGGDTFYYIPLVPAAEWN